MKLQKKDKNIFFRDGLTKGLFRKIINNKHIVEEERAGYGSNLFEVNSVSYHGSQTLKNEIIGMSVLEIIS